MVLIVGGAYQGKVEFAKSLGFKEQEIFANLQELIKTLIENNDDIEVEIKKVLQNYKVITVNEVGSGLVPMEKNNREYRDLVGKISCDIAKNSEVYRVIAGVGVKLK